MLEVIQNDDSKIKNKKYIKNGVETSMNILPFNRNDYNSNISYIFNNQNSDLHNIIANKRKI